MAEQNTNYFKVGLYITGTIAVLVAVYMIFRAFTRAKAGVASIGDAIQDTRVDNDIATQNGLSVSDVDKARLIAKNLAVEMETFKSMSATDKLFHVGTDKGILDICSQITSTKQMRVVASIYQNEITNNHKLYKDLETELSSSNFRKVPFIESILK